MILFLKRLDNNFFSPY